MNLYKRGNVWWFKVQFEGKCYRKTTDHTNKAKAETAAAAFKVALANRNFGIIERKSAPQFADAMTAFLEWHRRQHTEHPASSKRATVASRALVLFFKKSLDEITSDDVEAYKTRRTSQKGRKTKRTIMNSTINRELAVLKMMFNYTLNKDHTYGFRNPVDTVKFLEEKNKHTRVLSFDEQQRYLAVASPVLKDVAMLMLETGMRPEEVYRITVENVFLDQSYLNIPFGKTIAAQRHVPLTSIARDVLKRRIAAAEGAYVFPHRSDPNRPVWKVADAHTKALKDSKLRKFRLYDLRHTWATRAAQAGMDLTTLAALLGHAKLVMIPRYVHVQQDHQADAMRRLEVVNAAKQIAEAERLRAGTKMGTVIENDAMSSVDQKDSNSTRIN